MSMPRILSSKVLALVVAGAGSAAIATTFVGEREGRSLTAYQDIAKVWTICDGHTKGVLAGQTATPEQCDSMRATDVGEFMAQVDRIVRVPMSEARRAAVTSFAYNVGLANLRGSTFLRRLNAGDPNACDDILKWVYVGGKDCRDPANTCRGIVTRREQEAALCRL